MFEIINPNTGKTGKQHKGNYTDHLPALKKIAPVTIIQHTPRPDEDGTGSYPVHIGTPCTQTRGRAKIARYCVIALTVALLTTSCAKSPAGAKLPIEDLETGMQCESPDTTIDLNEDWEACYRLAHAFAIIESNDNPKAVNNKENAVGLLQIRPIKASQHDSG